MIERREHLGGVARPSGLLNLSQHPGRDMRVRPQWVCWRYELIGNHWKKPPFNPLTGRKVDTTTRQPFVPYKAAARTAYNGDYDGIGYVFFPEERFIRVDLDDCRNPETGQLDQWAMEILALLNTYAEVSPSGEGIHAIAKGTLHGRDRKVNGLGEYHRGTLEMYSQGQNYFTWTNERLGLDEIRACSDECNILYDCAFWQQLYEERGRERLGGIAPERLALEVQTRPRTPGEEKADTWLLDRARRARNGQAFSKLYDELPGPGSQHEDDFKVCMMLLYWTQDQQGIPNLSWADRLFRQSQRFIGGRWEKWDRRLGQYTYGQVTLQKAYLQRYIQFGPGWNAAAVLTAHQERAAASNLLNQD